MYSREFWKKAAQEFQMCIASFLYLEWCQLRVFGFSSGQSGGIPQVPEGDKKAGLN